MRPAVIDSRDKDSLKPLVAELFGKIDELLEQNGSLVDQVKTLLARIADLEGRAGQPPKSPTNSSLPPSRGQKANAPASDKKSRKGRPGVARDLCPNPDVTRDIYAERCACGTTLSADDQELAHAYDHIDLPPIKPITTRINLHTGTCPCCRNQVSAKPPVDMPAGTPFGPNIASIVTYFHGCQLVSYARLTELMQGMFGLKISEGALATMLARTAVPLATEADKIAAIVRASAVVASDETSARVKGKTFWQWVFATSTAVYHIIAPTRGKCVPVDFLGAVKPDVWISDRLAAQHTHARLHQYCLAHLIGDAQYAIDAGDRVFAPLFHAVLHHLCGIGRRRPDMSDAELAKAARDNARRLVRLLDLEPTQKDGRHLRDAIQVTARDKLMVFLKRRDVDPTNNVSERELRPSVIFRKVTNGFRSLWGAKAHADLRSIVAPVLSGLAALLAGAHSPPSKPSWSPRQASPPHELRTARGEQLLRRRYNRRFRG